MIHRTKAGRRNHNRRTRKLMKKYRRTTEGPENGL